MEHSSQNRLSGPDPYGLLLFSILFFGVILLELGE